ncbi:hypothetical protein SPIRO4BDMA_50431 [uncultured spirochete]|uniref:Uncharacterized protein n=1 Tax=uncultured spirochete TaxID=156406 RepID=A0A3P3XRG9_9SPIR|nr:hypothetical protein SPIRO4BDMA_50431 [uncultured spirochete]
MGWPVFPYGMKGHFSCVVFYALFLYIFIAWFQGTPSFKGFQSLHLPRSNP